VSLDCRLEREVLGGRLWHSECQAGNGDLPEGLPLTFESAGAYVRAFEPLLFEEAREAVRGGWAEGAENGRCWPTDVIACGLCLGCDPRLGGWVEEAHEAASSSWPELTAKCRCWSNDVTACSPYVCDNTVIKVRPGHGL